MATVWRSPRDPDLFPLVLHSDRIKAAHLPSFGQAGAEDVGGGGALIVGRSCRQSGHASNDKCGASISSPDNLGMKSPRPAIVRGRMNDTQIRGQFEFERIQAEGQSLSNGFQRCLLEAPKLTRSPQARQAAYRANSPRLGFRKELSSKFYRLQVPGIIFEVYTDPVCRGPRAKEAEPAGGEAKPDIGQIWKVGTPSLRLLESDPR